MNEYITSPNQKTIKIIKEKTDKQNLYTAINLKALEQAARTLKSGAFKLWIYFAKNQNNYFFALSNKAVAENFGIKKDQYDKAIKELIQYGYLVQKNKNDYEFREIAEKTTFENGEKPLLKVGNANKEKWEKPIRNNTDNTTYNTNNNTTHTDFIF